MGFAETRCRRGITAEAFEIDSDIGHSGLMANLEIDLRAAERDLAKDDAARLRQLLEEVRSALHGAGTAEAKVAWLKERLAS
jgi:hypothetical protein